MSASPRGHRHGRSALARVTRLRSAARTRVCSPYSRDVASSHACSLGAALAHSLAVQRCARRRASRRAPRLLTAASSRPVTRGRPFGHSSGSPLSLGHRVRGMSLALTLESDVSRHAALRPRRIRVRRSSQRTIASRSPSRSGPRPNPSLQRTRLRSPLNSISLGRRNDRMRIAAVARCSVRVLLGAVSCVGLALRSLRARTSHASSPALRTLTSYRRLARLVGAVELAVELSRDARRGSAHRAHQRLRFGHREHVQASHWPLLATRLSGARAHAVGVGHHWPSGTAHGPERLLRAFASAGTLTRELGARLTPRCSGLACARR